eukprot:TRINITY_DN272_c0_g1_i1.p1 TRINITY_DN272_c0_g1~~TRINITY_DN272_c0_g1_i1.p1  ORF type:complete len:340 (-),score=57.12 TRINITY_DN272_c0_g1_i1:79-1098(-)
MSQTKTVTTPKVTIDSLLPVQPLQLDEETKAQLRVLTKRSLFKDIQAIVADYAAIAALFAAGFYFTSWTSWVILGILIATRQHALLILMHEATHGRILKSNYWNVRLSNFLFSWPFVLDSLGYRAIHMKHHRYLYTDDDPDISGIGRTYAGQFPKSMWGMVWLVVREYLLGYILTIKYLIDTNLKAGPASTTMKKEDAKDQRQADEARCSMTLFISYYVVMIAVVTACKAWTPFFWLWLFPMATWLQVILRLRFVAEHFGVAKTNALNLSRNNLSHNLEGFLLTPHHVNYHIAHHLFPNVPHYNLKQLHELLWANCKEYREGAHQSSGIGQVLYECTQR